MHHSEFYVHFALVFEGLVHATGKKPEPSQTESEKTEPLFAVVCGSQPVATTVFWFFDYLKTD